MTKTHFADDKTLEYIAELEARNAKLQADLAAAQRDAGRYWWLQHRVRGAKYWSGDSCFTLPEVKPIGNIFKGSVAEHFDTAIDAALSAGEKQ